MKLFNDILALITALAAGLTAVVSALAVKSSLITIIILSILKLTEVVVMPWFAGPFVLGAISTGLWMILFGILVLIVSVIVITTCTAIIKT